MDEIKFIQILGQRISLEDISSYELGEKVIRNVPLAKNRKKSDFDELEFPTLNITFRQGGTKNFIFDNPLDIEECEQQVQSILSYLDEIFGVQQIETKKLKKSK